MTGMVAVHRAQRRRPDRGGGPRGGRRRSTGSRPRSRRRGDRPRGDGAGHLLRPDAHLHADVLRRDAARPRSARSASASRRRSRRRVVCARRRRRSSPGFIPIDMLDEPRLDRDAALVPDRLRRRPRPAPPPARPRAPVPRPGRARRRAGSASSPRSALIATLPINTWIRLVVWLADRPGDLLRLRQAAHAPSGWRGSRPRSRLGRRRRRAAPEPASRDRPLLVAGEHAQPAERGGEGDERGDDAGRRLVQRLLEQREPRITLAIGSNAMLVAIAGASTPVWSESWLSVIDA